MRCRSGSPRRSTAREPHAAVVLGRGVSPGVIPSDPLAAPAGSTTSSWLTVLASLCLPLPAWAAGGELDAIYERLQDNYAKREPNRAPSPDGNTPS